MKANLIKFIIIKIIWSALIGFLLFSCSPEDDGIYYAETENVVLENKVSYSAMELEILSLVNDHRKSLNLSVLNRMDIISSVANGHTNYMIAKGTASHDNFAQRSQDLITNANAKTVGENVAYGFSSAQSVVSGWLKSEGHKGIIEASKYTHFGISTDTDSQGRNYFTHIYISK
jgi:uncharacterized protein YkwD